MRKMRLPFMHAWLPIALLVAPGTGQADCRQDIRVGALSQCRAVTILVGVTAGGASDVFAREISAYLRQAGIGSVVLNLPGASGHIAFKELASEADVDCKFMMGTSASMFLNAYNEKLRPRLVPLESYAPVGLIARNPMFLAVNSEKNKISTVADFVTRYKAGGLFYATPRDSER
jgi:tripartite-type tricarboxylate transporter receptor subunit TctC